jgi:hypothetical protein
VSVAAAAVLLVGVILAVRAGGPDREPSAFVSPSAQGGSGTGADEPTTTAAPTTTAPPTDATEPGSADTGLADDVPSTTDGGTRQGPASSDVPSTDRGSRGDDYVTPPTTDRLRRRSDDDGQAATQDPSATRRSGQSSATSAPTDDTGQWHEHLSGWDFDLSEWPWARELWDAVGDTGEPRDAVDPDGDAPGAGDDDQGRERRDTERDHGPARDGVSDDGDAGDNEPVDEPGDAPRG